MGSARCRFVAVTVVVVAAAVLSAQQPLQLRPVDEARQHPDFLAFRRQLQQTIARRDSAALLRALDPAIKNSFDGDDGKDGFTRRWRPRAADSEVWQELGAVLALGGTFDGADAFVAPYVFSRWPNQIDAFEHVAVIGSNVAARATPDAQAGVMQTLTFSILRLAGDGGYPQRPWTAVVLPDGRTAYLASRYVRSPIDYRAYFRRSNGGWRMTMFLAGD
jgi:hypothetical protein